MKRPLSSPPRPRKRFGQHFLVEGTVVSRIVELIRPAANEGVVEIGPGRGVLTEPLCASLDRLVAVEIDRDLAEYLRNRIDSPALRLIEADVLDLDLCALAQEEGFRRLLVLGNIPYNITAPLTFHLLEHRHCIGRAILMVQREVARRLVAGPGSRDYSLLTVLLGMHAQAEMRLQVSRDSFRPPPRVESAVVEIVFSANCRYPVRDEARFERLVRTAFGQRRKMLRNSLLAMVGSQERADLAAIGDMAGIDLSRRPETLSLEEFVRVSDAFTAAGEATPA